MSILFYFNPAIPLLEIRPSDIYTSAHGKTGAQWFHCRGFRTAVIQKSWEQSKGPPAEDGLNEAGCLYPREYNAALIREHYGHASNLPTWPEVNERGSYLLSAYCVPG